MITLSGHSILDAEDDRVSVQVIRRSAVTLAIGGRHKCQRSMSLAAAVLFFLVCMITPAVAQSKQQESQPNRQDWLLCQSGDVESCNRLLRLPLNDETRALVEVDLQQARDRLTAQVRGLLQVCNDSGNVRACDRALRYNLPAADRREILELRKTVVDRTSQRASR